MNFWGNHYSGMISVIKRSIMKTVYAHTWRSSWSFLLGSFTISFWAINRLVSSQRMILAIRSTGRINYLSLIFSFVVWFQQTVFFLYQMPPLPLPFMMRGTCYYLWWTPLSFWWLNKNDEFLKLRVGLGRTWIHKSLMVLEIRLFSRGIVIGPDAVGEPN